MIRRPRHSRSSKPPQQQRPSKPAPRSTKPPQRSNVYRRSEAETRAQQPGMLNTAAARGLARAAEPFCGIKAKCGACEFVNLAYEHGLQTKHERGIALLEATGMVPKSRILPPVKAPRPFEYRSLFKLAVRPAPVVDIPPPPPPPLRKDGDEEIVPELPAAPVARFAIGLFEAGSHQVVDMDDCPLHTVPLKLLIKDLRAELDASTLTPFDETTHTGQVRYLAARAAHITGEIMLTFVVTEPLKLELRRIVERLQRRGHKINSAHMNVNTERGNAIFSRDTVRVAGADGLRERVMDLNFEVGPTSFFQVNPWQAINLYRRIEQLVGPASGGDTIQTAPVAWDLYCGIGQISLVLARLGYRTLGIEENPEAIRHAEANARRNRLDGYTSFIASRVEDSTDKLPAWSRSPSMIVVNPSRRGLAESTRQHLAMMLVSNPEARFVYVSCNVETLARDLKALEKTGFSVRLAEAFDMFPQTDGMEWLVVMTR